MLSPHRTGNGRHGERELQDPDLPARGRCRLAAQHPPLEDPALAVDKFRFDHFDLRSLKGSSIRRDYFFSPDKQANNMQKEGPGMPIVTVKILIALEN
ncbi:hypothetical protein chiPu_0010813 [Chiloscyllium punctatum]|uniref:Uncharacterized protein n=1 Tax=Chiloscyllium punctatum TaxID=137246 RepID=A0A401SPP2_CHIPU|nr:hypothetical protein [Chiloscyllium punctatum]